jgi:cellobiose transport system permease protein
MNVLRRRWATTFFLSPYIVMYLAFGLIPIIFSFYVSLTKWDGIGDKSFIGLQNYFFLFSGDSYFFKSIWNVLVIMILYLPVQIAFGLFLANLLYSRYVKWKSFFQLANFLPYIVTPVAIGIIFNLLFDWQTGIVNKVLMKYGFVEEAVNWLGDPVYSRLVVALMLFWKGFGYTMVFYLAGLANIQKDLYEAAWVDGASPARTFFQITLPLLKPVTSFILITGIIGGFQLLEEPMLVFKGMGNSQLIGGPDRCCLTPIWNMYDTAFGTTTRYGLGAAIAYGLCIIIAVVSFIGYRFLDKGEQD